MSSARGQATLEYVGAILLLAVALVAAAVAIAAPGLPETVLAKLRLALCIVGADVCSAADAAARGLEPCLLTAEDHNSASGVSLLTFRVGGTDRWSLQRSSDGSIVLGKATGPDAQATTGVGFDAFGVHVGGSVAYGGAFMAGKAWHLSARTLRDLQDFTRGDPGQWDFFFEELLGEPDERYVEGGGVGSAQLAAEAIRELPAAGADARAVLGRRRTPEGTTYYVNLGGSVGGPITDSLPGLDVTGAVAAEYRDSDPPVVTLRATGRDHDGDETQTVLRLPLRDAADRAAARRVAFLDMGDPAPAVRDLVARIRDRGTVERLRYRTREAGEAWAYGGKLGVALGIDRATSVRRRDLVDAEVLNGTFPARREDCLSGSGTSSS